MKEWGSRKKWIIKFRDRRENEMDRKNKHCRRQRLLLHWWFGEDKQFSREVYGIWDA